ncbi:MAG: DUF624 domain-containing protein [Oscillospiraceae bacterium]|nr:DUF624 domain-containing protein [Oscillospiraceae bacterium]
MLKKIFDAENPVMQALAVVCDLLLLNLFTLLCCLPVLTAGAALAALNDVLQHMVREEGAGVFRMFFRSFRANLRRGVPLGLIFIFAGLLIAVDYLAATAYVPSMRAAAVAVGLIVLAVSFYAFALQARFENSVAGTLRNALSLAIAYFPRTLGMLVFALAMWLLCIHFYRYALPVLVMFGFSLPCYINTLLLKNVLKRLEQQ